MIVELTITTLAHGGSGLGHHDGKAVFVQGAVPGDRVQCRIFQNKKRYARAELMAVLEPSAVRQTPPCPYFGDCGGCDWQQLPYDEQCRWKQQLFADSCERHGHIDPAQVLPLVSARQTLAYRSRVQFKCHNTPDGFVLGFFRRGSHYVIDIDHCPVIASQLSALIAPLRQLFDGSAYASVVPQIDVATGSDDRCRIVVHFLGAQPDHFHQWLYERTESWDAAVLVQSGRKSSLCQLHGDSDLVIEVDEPPVALRYGPGGIAQVHLEQNRALVDLVITRAGVSATDRVLDLYCGMGNFSLPLARRAASVVGVEDYPLSIDYAKRNSAAQGFENTRFFARAVESFMPQWQEPVDVIVLDPPRSGAREALDGILACRPRKIVYVSCDQQTMMRDLKVLGQGYQVVSIQAVDMFPQTCHTEAVAVLERRQP